MNCDILLLACFCYGLLIQLHPVSPARPLEYEMRAVHLVAVAVAVASVVVILVCGKCRRLAHVMLQLQLHRQPESARTFAREVSIARLCYIIVFQCNASAIMIVEAGDIWR